MECKFGGVVWLARRRLEQVMRLMRYFLALVSAAALAASAGGTLAEEKPSEDRPGPGLNTGPNCTLTGYTSHVVTFPTPGIPIPDGAGISPVLPGIVTAADMTSFTDVIVGFKVDHTWVGDLVATVAYDQNSDLTPEFSAVVVCRPGRECNPAGAGFGCNSNLSCSSSYLFSDEALGELGLENCATTDDILPGGCYKPSAEAALPLSAFNGKMKGGTFSLQITDNAAQDVGFVCEWSVHYKAVGPTVTQRQSWGRVKSAYR